MSMLPSHLGTLQDGACLLVLQHGQCLVSRDQSQQEGLEVLQYLRALRARVRRHEIGVLTMRAHYTTN